MFDQQVEEEEIFCIRPVVRKQFDKVREIQVVNRSLVII